MQSDHEIALSNAERAYIGDDYFNPYSQFEAGARKLSSIRLDELLNYQDMKLYADEARTYFLAQVFAEASALLQAGELLFGAYCTGRYPLAVFIVNVERLLDFEKRVLDGSLQRIGLFGIPRDFATIGLTTDFAPP